MAEFGKELFDMGWRNTYREELRSLNEGKVGHPFIYPQSLITWAMTLRTVLGISYRLTLGIMNHFLEEEGLRPMGLTQLRVRRVFSAIVDGSDDERFLACGKGNTVPNGNKVTVAIDSTGLSLNKYGGWIVNKWGLKKVTGWIKLHVAVNVDTNEILAFIVTTESCGDITCLDKLMELVLDAGHDVGSLLADAAYDSKAAWKKYTEMGMHVCINIKSSQLTEKAKPTGHLDIRFRGCAVRGIQMMRIKEVGREKWKIENGYPMRWKVECTFSDLKRILGDILRSRTLWTNVLETLSKVTVFNRYKAIRRSVAEA